jgi:uroporphyrinogen decarboxylase
MANMTHRRRVLAALNHEEPDRVPKDLGQGPATGINTVAYMRLVEHLGLQDQDADSAVNPFARATSPSEAVLRRFDIDCRALPVSTIGNQMLDENTYGDEWGSLRARAEGGQFIYAGGPFQRKEPTLAELDAYDWPDPRDPARIEGLKDTAVRLRQENEYATVLYLPYTGMEICQRVRGFAEFLEDLAANPVLAEAILEHVMEVVIGIAEFVLDEVGEYIDVVGFGDDLGVQNNLMLGLEMYRRQIKPFHRRMVEAIKSRTDAKVLMHNDGAIFPLIPDLIDVGVDCINPVQVSAHGMDSERLKAEFGADMCFWGAIDTHFALPRGTVEEVRNEVRNRIRDLAPGGGYVVGSVHTIQAEVTAENIVAMFDTVEEFGRYPNLTTV